MHGRLQPGTTATLLACGRCWWLAHGTWLRSLGAVVLIQGAIAGLGFLTRIAVANSLGTRAFGDLALAVAIGTYGQVFVQFGLDKSLVREFVHFPRRMGELLVASLWIRGGLCAILGIVGVVLAGSGVLQESVHAGMLPAMVATVLGAFQLSPVFDACQQVQRHSWMTMIERCTYFAAIWLLVGGWGVGLNLAAVGGLMLATVVFGLGLQFHWVAAAVRYEEGQGVAASCRELLQTNGWVWLAAAASLSIEYLNQVILGWEAGADELGKFSAAWSWIALGLMVLGQATRFGAATVARYTMGQESQRQTTRFLLQYAAALGGVGLLLGLPCLLVPELLVGVFRAEYRQSAATLRILGLVPLLYGPYLAVLQYVIAARLNRTYLVLTVLTGGASIGCSCGLIPRWGVQGAAWSAVLSLAWGLLLFGLAAWRGTRYKNATAGV